jgi:hypothetical protein
LVLGLGLNVAKVGPDPEYLMLKLTFLFHSLLVGGLLLLSLFLGTHLDRHYLMVFVLLGQNTLDAQSDLTVLTKSLDFLRAVSRAERLCGGYEIVVLYLSERFFLDIIESCLLELKKVILIVDQAFAWRK